MNTLYLFLLILRYSKAQKVCTYTTKALGNKGYISNKIFEKLFEKYITMITKVRSNMKNKLLTLEDKLFLRKRAVIESVNNILK